MTLGDTFGEWLTIQRKQNRFKSRGILHSLVLTEDFLKQMRLELKAKTQMSLWLKRLKSAMVLKSWIFLQVMPSLELFVVTTFKQRKRVTKFPRWFCLPSTLRFTAHLGKKYHWCVSYHWFFVCVFLLRNLRLFHKHILLELLQKLSLQEYIVLFPKKFYTVVITNN
jgi:hypothetical protein